MEKIPHNQLRIALYCRVSTEEQREGQTIDSQVQELEKFTQDKAWIAVQVYKDEGWSGSLLARPALDRLRDDASRGLFDAVLINDVDRLARDVTHLGVIKRDLERHGIRIIFRKLPGDQSPTQNLLINILGSFAEFERELIADRTRRGKRYKAEVRKQFIGSLAPYGFRYVQRSRSGTETGRLELITEEATVVQLMYQWVDVEKLSALKVVKRLNILATPTRKRHGQWQKSSVLRILRSEVYAGVWHYNKHQLCEPLRRTAHHKYRKSYRTSAHLRPKSEWLPVPLPENLRIVDRAQWMRVQAQLDSNRVFSPRNTKHTYLLSGLVRCGGCRAAYVGNPSHGYFQYRCSKRCKTHAIISADFLDATVWDAVVEAVKRPDLIIAAITEIERHSTKLDDEALDTKHALEKLKAEESRTLDAYRKSILSPDQLAEQLQELKARKGLLEAKLLGIQRVKPDQGISVQHSVEQYCQSVSSRVHNLDQESRQKILRMLLQQVIFEGSQVTLQGKIPARAAATSGNNNVNDDISVGGIATTTSWNYGRNNADLSSLETGSDGYVSQLTFKLARKIKKDVSASIAASRANLVKANAARKRLV